MNDPERAHLLFEPLLKRAGRLQLAGANEAATRLELVDEALLFLGWQKSDFNPEEATDLGGYTDYLLKSDGVPLLVVEAKRIGRTFTLPDSVRKREYTAKYLSTSCGPELAEAMQQAARYCNEKGAHHAAVTNGSQWVIFRGTASHRQGWASFRAVVFHSPADLRQNFTEFWNLLAKDRVLDGSLQRRFASGLPPVPEFIDRPNSHYQRGYVQTDAVDPASVDFLFDYYFDDITKIDNGKMLDECYVEEKEVKEYNRELQLLLRERLLSLGEEVDTQELTERELQTTLTQPLRGDKAKVVLLVGHVGAGKTTFLNRFFNSLEEKQTYAKFIFDVMSEGNPAGKVRDNEGEFVSKLILERVSDHYARKSKFGSEYDPYDKTALHTMFYSVIRRMKEGPKKAIYEQDPDLCEREIAEELVKQSAVAEQLLPRYLNYIYKRRTPWRPFCLIFDNVDRASDEYQEFIYNFAHTLARSVPGVFIISMRETTYRLARLRGFLDTRASDKVFQLNAPNLKVVVSKRLKYLNYQYDNPKTAGRAVRPYLDKMVPVADHLKKLFLLDDQSARELITSLSNRSVRAAFKLLRQYASSPYAWTPWDGGKAGQHALRALMLTKYLLYKSDDSPIINLFEVSTESRGSHFLLLKLLAYLRWKHQAGTPVKDSPTVEAVQTDFEYLGVPRSLVHEALVALVGRELVESDNRFTVDEGLPADVSGELRLQDRVRISATGYYYLMNLTADKLYLTLCATDTVWYSKAHYDKFIEEYETYLEFVKDDPNYDIVGDTKCLQYWLEYLGVERKLEERYLSILPDTDWRSIILKAVDSVTPVSELEVETQRRKGRKGGTKSTMKKRKGTAQGGLWEQRDGQ